jgi:hypothetical protein
MIRLRQPGFRDTAPLFVVENNIGVYIEENTPPPTRGGGILADVLWGKKYEKGKRKRWQMFRKKEKREKNKENGK